MSKQLKVGDKAPAFALPDQDGKMVDVGAMIGTKALVVYFYPKDFTAGCTMEAHEFRDLHEQLKSNGAEVIGVSADPVESHKRFIEENKLPFMILSDSENKARDMFGAWDIGGMPGRVTYLIDKQGVIRMVFSSQIQPKKHAKEALKVLNEINQEVVRSSA